MVSESFSRAALIQKQSLSLESKVHLAESRIRDWYEHWDGDVYVSFSGGKDSTVLLHLVRSLYPEVPAVFADTGLEFPEIRKFALEQENVIILKPQKTFRRVIEEYGYPVISKEVADNIAGARRSIEKGVDSFRLKKLRGEILRADGKPSRFNCPKWAFLLDAPFKISANCCDVMKKQPFKRYEKETGRKPFLGTMAAESQLRTSKWVRTGCNAFNAKRPTSAPLSVWTEADIWEYIRTRDLPYSPIYDMGYERTGCMFCMFGAHCEGNPNRFQLMKETHPKVYDYCMKPWDEHGLGLKEVLEYIGVPHE